MGAYGYWRRNPHDAQARQAWSDALDGTCRWLWNGLMGDVIDALARLGANRAVLVPQGWLGLLPLHAAWTERDGARRYAIDEVSLTYAPNARTVTASDEAAARIAPISILAVDEPQPVSAKPLVCSGQEVAAALEHFERKDLLGGTTATKETVRDKLRDYAVLHFSCHGLAGFAQPLEGGLLMAHDQRLTLREMLSLRLEGLRLAVLSACETGIPGTNLPDEVISLPMGLVQAGAAGVVASLWSVSDLSTMLLMARFYELWRRDGLEPPEALRRAQQWLRDTTNGEKAAYLKDSAQQVAETRLPGFVAEEVYGQQQVFFELRAEEKDFAHPFYWAAFGYSGV
jgi:CHAT domain-containing protein